MAKIYLIRHCESEGNACRRTQAQVDALVTTKGYQQVEALRERFANIPVDAVYSSDTFRSLMTAEPIARDHNAPVRVRISLREVTTGIWEDMAWGNIAKEYPEENRVWDESPWAAITPGATSFRQAADRVVHCLQRIAKEVGETGSAVVVSHSCSIKSALCIIMGKPIHCVKEVLHSDNTAVSLLDIDTEGNITIEYMNDASHLPQHLKRAWHGVAGADLNMAVDPVQLPQQQEVLLDLAESSARERGVEFDRDAYLKEVEAIVTRNPGYIAMSSLKGQVVGFLHMDRETALGEECALVKTMYVKPELQGKGYCEQLFGYVAWVLRYSDIFRVAMYTDCTAEEQRVMDRFTFVVAKDHPQYRTLDLACRPCPYPILA